MVQDDLVIFRGNTPSSLSYPFIRKKFNYENMLQYVFHYLECDNFALKSLPATPCGERCGQIEGFKLKIESSNVRFERS